MAAPARAADAGGAASSLLSHGTEKQLWVTDTQRDPLRPSPSMRTTIQSRILGKAWQPWGTIQGRVVALGHRNNDLAVLFQDGQWLLFWNDGSLLNSSIGEPLPRSLNARIITFATDSQTLWAVARIAPAEIPPTTATTRPHTTAPTGTTTQASTSQSVPERLALFSLRFDRWQWVEHATLPAEFNAMDSSNASFAVVDRQPVIAMAGPDHTLIAAVYPAPDTTTLPSTATRPLAADWTMLPTVRAPFQLQLFQVMGDSQRPGPILLWAAADTGAGVIFTQTSDGWSQPIPLQLDEGQTVGRDRTVTLAGGRIRLTTRDPDTKSIVVRQFDLQGQSIGEQAALQSAENPLGRIEFYMEMVLMAALVIAVIGTFHRRKQAPKPLPPDQLALASTRQRFIAGLIDLIPVFAGIAVAAAGMDPSSSLSSAQLNPHMKWALWGVFVYLFYASAMEMICGRTLGKMLLHLRVVTVEGQKADWSALLMRNVLRIVDIWLAWIPLALIFYTPLRQRIGDVAAATVVVTSAGGQQEKPPPTPVSNTK